MFNRKRTSVMLIASATCMSLYLFNNCTRGQVEEVFSSDYDTDGVSLEHDNCPTFKNLDQSDVDGDGVGDVCDGDYIAAVMQAIEFNQ